MHKATNILDMKQKQTMIPERKTLLILIAFRDYRPHTHLMWKLQRTGALQLELSLKKTSVLPIHRTEANRTAPESTKVSHTGRQLHSVHMRKLHEAGNDFRSMRRPRAGTHTVRKQLLFPRAYQKLLVCTYTG
jgi:hypothetical protein